MALLFNHLSKRFKPSLRAFSSNSDGSKNGSESSRSGHTNQGERTKAKKEKYTGRLFDPDLFESPYKDINKFYYLLPDIPLNYIRYNPENSSYELKTIKSTEHFAHKRVVLLGFVGAFIPECTNIFLPSWARAFKRYQTEFDMDEFVAVSTNDVYVMQAFAKNMNLKENMSYIADSNLALTRALEKAADLSDIQFGIRSERYTGFLINNKVTSIHQCAYNHLFYVEAMGPEYIEKIAKDPFIKPRFFFK